MQQRVTIGRKPTNEKPVETPVDPVCKMLVTRETAAATFEHKGDLLFLHDGL